MHVASTATSGGRYPAPPRSTILRFLKKWVTDGWLTHGKPIATEPGQVKAFAVCIQCRAVYPHWDACMTAGEAKKRGYIGCRCGCVKIQPARIPGWKAVWWFVVRGWFIRHVLWRRPRWDPRMPVLENDYE